MNRKQYRKWKRKQRRAFRKLLRNDRPWDYEYLVNILRFKIEQMYDYFMNSSLQLYQDSPIIEDDKLVISSLQECKELFDLLDTNLCRESYVEQEIYNRLFDIISKNLMYWWN